MPEMTGVTIPAGGVMLAGDLAIPRHPTGIVLFAHGSGSSRFSHRNRNVAATLQHAGFATLLFDLLTDEEEADDVATGMHRFDVSLLAERLLCATDWLRTRPDTRALRVGYFGASTGAAAALIAAATKPDAVAAVVSRGGRPDLAARDLPSVKAPTLLIVGEFDPAVVEMNLIAKRMMRSACEFVTVVGASHLFEEPGTLAEVARLAEDWFVRHVAHTPAPQRVPVTVDP